MEEAHGPLHTATLRNEGKEKMKAKARSTSNHGDLDGDVSLRTQPCSQAFLILNSASVAWQPCDPGQVRQPL